MTWYDYVNIGLLLIIWGIISLDLRSITSVRMYWLLFFAVYTLTEFFSILIILLGNGANLVLYNVSKPLQFVLVVAYLLNILGVARVKLVYWLAATSAISLYFLRLQSQDWDKYHSLEDVVFGAVIITLCIFYYKRIIQSETSIDLAASEFWFCSSLFTYFGANLWINGAMDYLIDNKLEDAQSLFYGLIINSYILYLITVYALTAARKIRQNNS